MSYRTIIVHLDDGKRRSQHIDLALVLAQRYDAHLVGLFGLPRPDFALAPEAAPVLADDLLRVRRQAAETAAKEFYDRMESAQYLDKSDWRATPWDGLAALRFYARHADLVVAGQPDPDGSGVPASFSHELVMTAGRPVLYVPFAGRFEDCGGNVLVAWNASREAARALRDGLPLLQKSKVSEVVTFDPEKLLLDDPDLPNPDMAAYLSRDGVTARVITRSRGDIDIGSAILSRAADNGSDLIVLGAYSHSRVRELVLGGATRALFESMTMPTLMSH